MNFAPFPHQQMMIDHIVNTPTAAVFAGMGLGKEHPCDTPIPTPTGYREIGDLKVGDQVFDIDGHPTEVTGVFPQGPKEVYTVTFSDGAHVECGADHLWAVKTPEWKRDIKTGLTDEHGCRVFSTQEMLDRRVFDKSTKHQWWIPRSGSARFGTDHNFRWSAYQYGYLLGNGSYCGESLQITCHTDDFPEIIQLFPSGFRKRTYGNTTHVNYPNKFRDDLRKDLPPCKSLDKFIPEQFFATSETFRKGLLRGLLDSDGSCARNRTVFHSCSPKLAHGVKLLVDSLGGFASVRRYDRSHEGKSAEYQVRIQTDFCPFKLRRKASQWRKVSKNRKGKRRIISIKRTGYLKESVCISVAHERQLYQVSRFHVVTHNTSSTLAAFSHLLSDGAVKAMLIVSPLRVTNLTWPNEVAKWDNFRHFTVANLRTPEGKKHWREGTADIYLINYEQLQQFAKWGFAEQKEIPADMIVWDELSKAKSPSSKRIRAIRKYYSRFKRHVGLTGTPTPNSYLDLFAQIRLLDNGKRLGQAFGKYRARFFTSDYMGFKWEAKKGAENFIQKSISDMTVTLSSEEYLDIPEVSTVDHKISLPKEARDEYKELEKELLLELEAGEIEAVNGAALVNKLLQITGGAVYDIEKQVHPIHDAKIAKLKQVAKSASGPCLIAYAFKHEKDRILKALPGAEEFREDRLDAWNAGEIPAIVAHPASIGHGLNLQEGGSDIVWFTPTYSRELYDQTNARLARTGQTERTTIHRILCGGTIDDAVVEALRDKGDNQAGFLAAMKNLQLLRQ